MSVTTNIVKLLYERSIGNVIAKTFTRSCLNQQFSHGCSLSFNVEELEERIARGDSVKDFLDYTLKDTVAYRHFDCIEISYLQQFNSLSAVLFETAIQKVVCAKCIVIVKSWISSPINGVTSILSSVLSSSVDITQIAFIDCSVKDEDLLGLTENTFVTHFSLRFSQITALGIRTIVKNFKALRFLDISGCEYENVNEVLALVAQYAPFIEGLDVSYPAYIPCELEQRVENDKIDQIGESAFRQMSNLTSLNLGAVRISNSTLKGLATLKLQNLYLGYNIIQYPRSLEDFGLGRLSTLTDLTLTQPFQFTDGHLLLISKTVGIRLKGFKLDGVSGSARDSSEPQVVEPVVYDQRSMLTSNGFKWIGTMLHLERLCISNISKLTDDIVLRHFRLLTKLRQLELTNCRNITDEAINQLAASLSISSSNVFTNLIRVGSYEPYRVLWASQIKIGYEDFCVY